MKDSSLTKQELIEELSLLKKKIKKLQLSESKHKQAEALLRESEERYRILFENAQEAIFVIQDARLVFINPNVTQQFGYSTDDFMSKSFIEFIHPDDQNMVLDNHIRRLKGEELPNTYSFRIIHKDGSVKWGDLSAVLISWQGKPATLNFLKDITGHKQIEEELRENEERYRSLVDNAQEAIFVIQDYKLVFINPNAAPQLGYTSEDFLSKTFLEFIHPDDQKMVFDNYTRRVMGEDFPNIYSFRLIHKDGSIKWAELNSVLINWKGKPAVMIFMTDVTDRKQAEELLRESEERYRKLFENVQEAIFVVQDGKLVFLNPITTRKIGFSAEELMSKSFLEFIHPDDQNMVLDNYIKRLKGEELPNLYPFRTIRSDGSVMWVELSAVSIDWQGRPATLNFLTEITDRKQSEDMLRESEERYRGLIDNAQEAIFVVQEYKLVFINPIATLMVGYSTEEFMSKSFIEFVHPDDQNMVFENHIRRMQGDQFNNTYCLRLVHKNGSVRWGELTAVLMNWNGKPATLNFMTDITDRKQSEEALKDSELMFRTLFEAANDAIFLMDDGTFIDCNPKALEMYGCGREQIIGHSPVNFSPDVQPDGSASREKAMEKINAALQGQPQLFEWKHRRYDGTLFDAEVSLNAFPAKGKYYIRSIVRDITDRKQIEEALRQSEERFRELSIVDDLTRLYNSRHFYAQLKIELERSKRYEQPLTLLMLDLDDFKAFNDTYGHIEGDEVLSRLGQVIKRCLRETDIAFRYGGEEFTILLPMTTGAEGAVIAERIRQEFKKETFSPKLDQAVHLTVSIGIGQYESGEDMRAFVHRVDLLMYHGKKNGKDRICSAS